METKIKRDMEVYMIYLYREISSVLKQDSTAHGIMEFFFHRILTQ
jgi:hypothetical protein